MEKMKRNNRVICINGDSSKMYEQVIFIMKNDNRPGGLGQKNPPARMDFVSEAERIINEKLSHNNKEIQKAQVNAVTRHRNGIQQVVIKKNSTFDTILNMMMLVGCVVLSMALIYISR